MYVALASLFLNVIFNYYLAFVLDYGHVGIAIGSSLAAIISVLTLEIVLYRDGLIKSKNIVNKFSFNVFISSLFLIIFLYFYTSEINFMKLTQVERIFYLSIEVFASVVIYFSISRLMLNKPLRFLFD
jgi:putative peptidoglycan lipid II flippase